VDVFFVISGFVIAMSAARAEGARAFMMDRMLRVLPLYFMVSAFFVAKRVVSGDGVTASALVNSVVFLPFLDTEEYTSPVHPYGWSIAFEMWFYLLLALLLVFVPQARAARACAGILTVGAVGVGVFYQGAWMLPRFVFSPLVLEFAAGCALYVFREQIRARVRYAAVALPGLMVAVALTTYLGYPTEVIGHGGLSFARATIWGGMAVCVFALFYAAEEKVRWPRSLVALGTASYSIYLIQPFVVRAVRGLEVAGSLRVASFIAVSIIAGSLMYFCLERPMLSLGKAWLRRPASPDLSVKDANAVLRRSPA
jgi:exopolysaccharide production protein ExoZ